MKANLKDKYTQKIMGYKTAISNFLNCENFGHFDIFKHFLFFQNSLQISKLKNGIYVLEEALKIVCTKFQVINSLQKRGFIAF